MLDIYFGDNLPVLQQLPGESFHLIYIDPPFNTGKRQARTRTKTIRDDRNGDRTGFQGNRYRTVKLGTRSFADVFDDYLGFLEPRLREARRLLVPHGSLFVHLDYREAHYCKVLLDVLFGRESFMNEIRSMTEKLVGTAKAFDGDTVPGDYGVLETPCPKCGGVVRETYKRFHCEADGCEFSFWKIMGGRQFELPEADELVANRRIGPLDGFRSKMGRAFSAELKLTGEHKVEFDFGNEDEDEEEVDFSGQEPVGTCPKCKGPVYEHGRAYVCEKNTGKVRECKFRTGKTILKRDIEKEQVAKLLKDGKTDLIPNFISKKGRPFKAYLVLKPDGDVGFEFEPRAKPAAKGGK